MTEFADFLVVFALAKMSSISASRKRESPDVKLELFEGFFELFKSENMSVLSEKMSSSFVTAFFGRRVLTLAEAKISSSSSGI